MSKKYTNQIVYKIEEEKTYNNLNNTFKELNLDIDFLRDGLIHESKLNKFLRMIVYSFEYEICSKYLVDCEYEYQYFYCNLMELFKNDKKVLKKLKPLLKLEGFNKYIIICFNSNTNCIFLHNSYSTKKEFNKELKRIDKEFKKIELENSFDNN